MIIQSSFFYFDQILVNISISLFALLVVALCYTKEITVALYAALKIYVLFVLAEVFASFYFSIFMKSQISSLSLQGYITIFVLSKVILVLLFLFVKSIVNRQQNLIFYPFWLKLLFIFTVLSGFIPLTLVYVHLIDSSTPSAPLILAFNLLFFSLIFIYLTFSRLETYYSDYLSNKILHQQNKYFARQLEMFKHNRMLTLRLKHDATKHLKSLDYLFRKEKFYELGKYLNESLEFVELLKEEVDSGNIIIDCLINDLLARGDDNFIQINKHISLEDDIHITDHDLTVILGNLFENALAAAKVSHQVKPTIDLSIVSLNGKFIFTMENDISETNCIYRKGIGLTNVERTLAKYKAKPNITLNKNRFQVSFVIYNPE